MSGLDLTAGIAGILSLSVTLFQGCLRGFVLLSTAHNYGLRADYIRLKLEVEEYRLLAWAEIINLESQTGPKRNLNWKLIEGILEQLLALVTNSDLLKKEYNLVI